MSSRFGAANPGKKNAKAKIMLGILLFVLLIALLVLFWLLQNNQQATGTEQTQPVAVQAPQQDMVGVYVPLFRIDAGAKLTEDMFKVESLPKDQVPAGAMLASQKSLVIEHFAARSINPNIALTKEDVADTQPLNTIDIPVGYRLITIIVDNRSGVEGYAKAGARVDVLWTFIQEGKKKIATLARFVKVISLAGNNQTNGKEEKVQVAGPVTVSLLVTEKQAKYLELARSTGELSLVLVGGTEPPPNVDAEPEIIDAGDMLGTPKPQEEEEVTNGTMVIGNETYVLKNGRWKKKSKE